MKSRYLSKLQQELAQAVTPTDESVVLGKMAFHYARLGKTANAVDIIRKVRSSTIREIENSPAVVCWINLAEGVISHYQATTSEARLKFERSRAVAKSLGIRRVAAISSSWLALSNYLSEELKSFVNNSIEAINMVDDENYSAISRLSLNTALCFHYGGEVGSAGNWYQRCRLAAVADGDEATLAALIHSMAWMSVSTKRNEQLLGGVEGVRHPLLLTTAETVESYELLVGAANVPAMTPLLLAQDRILCGDLEGAIALIDEHTDAACDQGFGRLAPGLLADRAHCLAMLGRTAEARLDAIRASELPREHLHGDDLAVLHSRLTSTFSILGMSTIAEFHRTKASEAWVKLDIFRREMVVAARTVEDALASNSVFQIK